MFSINQIGNHEIKLDRTSLTVEKTMKKKRIDLPEKYPATGFNGMQIIETK